MCCWDQPSPVFKLSPQFSSLPALINPETTLKPPCPALYLHQQGCPGGSYQQLQSMQCWCGVQIGLGYKLSITYHCDLSSLMVKIRVNNAADLMSGSPLPIFYFSNLNIPAIESQGKYLSKNNVQGHVIGIQTMAGENSWRTHIPYCVFSWFCCLLLANMIKGM